MWLVSALINQLILARLTYNMVKENNYIRIRGMVWLMVWAALLGPMFTALCGLIWYLERLE